MPTRRSLMSEQPSLCRAVTWGVAVLALSLATWAGELNAAPEASPAGEQASALRGYHWPTQAARDAMAPLPETLSVPWREAPINVIHAEEWVYREPGTDRILRLVETTAGVDDTAVGATTYRIWYQVSTDGGETFDPLRLLEESGPEFDTRHPIGPVHLPGSSYVASIPPPLRAGNGQVMVPFYYWPLDASGQRITPPGVRNFWCSGVLIGTWTEDGGDLTWELGETVEISPRASTRGLSEPTIAELQEPGHFIMVMRGSNDEREDTLAGYKWVSFSDDGCRTWTAARPWTYADGQRFYSPSSCSWLQRHSNGKLYWFGNISEENPDGNDPRYPIVMGVVDESEPYFGLIQDSIRVIDTRDPSRGDTEEVGFSNFNVREDPQTGDFIVELKRFDPGRLKPWPRERYVIPVPNPRG